MRGALFLLGKFELGAPPSFVNVNSDQRENFQVLIDSGAGRIERGMRAVDGDSRGDEFQEQPARLRIGCDLPYWVERHGVMRDDQLGFLLDGFIGRGIGRVGRR